MINYLGQKLTNGYEFPKILLYKDQWEHFIIFIFSYSKFFFPGKMNASPRVALSTATSFCKLFVGNWESEKCSFPWGNIHYTIN